MRWPRAMACAGGSPSLGCWRSPIIFCFHVSSASAPISSLRSCSRSRSIWRSAMPGLSRSAMPPLFNTFEFNPLFPKTQYLYALGVLLICFLFVRTLVYSPFGQSLTGIRENTLRMHAVGAPVRRRLITCYTISAAIAGIAGALRGQTNAYANLGSLGLDRAATVLLALLRG